MYIERLIIRGYKILKDLDITLKEKMNIFIGENDSGKSSVLEAIQIAEKKTDRSAITTNKKLRDILNF